MPREAILKIIQQHKKASIDQHTILSQLETQNAFDWDELLSCLKSMEDDGILKPVKSKGGRLIKGQYLANTWRIQSRKLYLDEKLELSKLKGRLSKQLDLSKYDKDPGLFENDFRKLTQISLFLDEYGDSASLKTMSLTELSWLMVGNEKWLEFEGGKAFLESLGLKHEHCDRIPDPVMFALTPQGIRGLSNYGSAGKRTMKHLIVENKVPWKRLVEASAELQYDTIVYGSGWKIAGNIGLLPVQLGIESERIRHEYAYYGDLDWEGISIWHSVYEKAGAVPEVDLYKAMINQKAFEGKSNHRKNEAALEDFLKHFGECEVRAIREILETGQYIPQEALSAVKGG